MIGLISLQHALLITAAAALLAGCAGSATPLMTLAEADAMVAPPGVGAARLSVARRSLTVGKSWMAPDAKKKDLLYVSDLGDGSVTVYEYPSAKQVGTLTGFEDPTGECSDKAGDVFITDFEASKILEYAHGGTTPIQTLSDPGQWPSGCSFDPTTGNLAVANDETPSAGEGNLAIYKHASGTPTTYTNSNMYYYFFCAYDNRGNLYVDGFNSQYVTQLAGLAKGSGNLTSITLNESITYPVGIQWDGKYVAIGAGSGVETIYQFKISGTTGTVEGSTDLSGATNVIQFWIAKPKPKHSQGTRVIAPDYTAGDVAYYAYPAGGAPSKSFTTGLDEPYGSTLSYAK